MRMLVGGEGARERAVRQCGLIGARRVAYGQLRRRSVVGCTWAMMSDFPYFKDRK